MEQRSSRGGEAEEKEKEEKEEQKDKIREPLTEVREIGETQREASPGQ